MVQGEKKGVKQTTESPETGKMTGRERLKLLSEILVLSGKCFYTASNFNVGEVSVLFYISTDFQFNDFFRRGDRNRPCNLRKNRVKGQRGQSSILGKVSNFFIKITL